MTHQAERPGDRIAEAEAARDELDAALRGSGIILPSLGLDSPSYFGHTIPPLIDLGRCSVGTARRLAAALRGAGSER
jgi:hypothetical protein